MLWEGTGGVGREVARWAEGIAAPERTDQSLFQESGRDPGFSQEGGGREWWIWVTESNKPEELLLGKSLWGTFFLQFLTLGIHSLS